MNNTGTVHIKSWSWIIKEMQSVIMKIEGDIKRAEEWTAIETYMPIFEHVCIFKFSMPMWAASKVCSGVFICIWQFCMIDVYAGNGKVIHAGV